MHEEKVNTNLITNDGEKWTPLTIAANSGFLDIVNTLIADTRTDVNLMASEARGTALHCACRIGSLPVC